MAVETAKKVQIIVYIEFALLGVGLLAAICLGGFRESILDKMVDGAEFYERDELMDSYRKNINQGIVLICATLIFSLILMAILFVGFRKDDDTKLDAWFIVHCLVLALMGFGVFYAMKSAPSALSPKKNVQTLIYLAYRIWSLVVLNQYIKELRTIPPAETPEPKPEA